jgi:hypothetical protein
MPSWGFPRILHPAGKKCALPGKPRESKFKFGDAKAAILRPFKFC